MRSVIERHAPAEYRFVQKLTPGESDAPSTAPTHDFQSLRAGERFLLFEPDGELIGRYIATGDAVPCEPDGNYVVECEPSK